MESIERRIGHGATEKGRATKANTFEDLRIWKSAREIVRTVYQLTSEGAFAHDYALRDQVRRAAVSIASNIAEGFSRCSNREFVQFLFIAKGSISEVQTQLYIALDQKYISQAAFEEAYDGLETIAKKTSRLITYLRTSDES